MAEIKKATTYDEQIDILRSRGVVINDEETCKAILENVHYYRLIAYFLPYKNPDNSYQEGTDFFHVYRLYEFDRKLRKIVFTALEEVEISLRSRLSYYHAHEYGPIGYLDPTNFNSYHDHDRFLDQIHREVENNKNVPFVKHHIEHYDGIFPVWAIAELFSFGMLSRFYSDFPLKDQKALSRELFHTIPQNIRSWLRCCTDLRNICAHYGRLYYRVFTAFPAAVSGTEDQLTRFWGALLALRGLYLDAFKWNNVFVPAISALIDEYSSDVNLYHMAFPAQWEKLLRK